MAVTQIHHVAYRCNDAQETTDFYTKILGLKFVMAISEDRVPSTGEPHPYMHIFFDTGHGSCIAFFELPDSPAMGKDPNTPGWVQHFAMQVESEAELLAMKQRLEDHGIGVVGPTDHNFIKSIYFFDPNGHRLELTARTDEPGLLDKLEAMAPDMLEEWNRGKKTVRQAAFLHEKELADK